jgi:hypothetical protein
MEDNREQVALFYLEGPDEDGRGWICSADPPGQWCHNLGHAAKVAELLSQWLASLDDGETDYRDTQNESEPVMEMDVAEFMQGFILGVLLGGAVMWAVYKTWQRPRS